MHHKLEHRGEGSGCHQNGQTTQSWAGPGASQHVMVQDWTTRCCQGWLEAGFGHSWTGTAPGLQHNSNVLPRGSHHPGSVCWWPGSGPCWGMDTHPGPGREAAGGADGLGSPTGLHAAVPAPPGALGAGRATSRVPPQSPALSSLSEYVPNKLREDVVVPVAVGDEPVLAVVSWFPVPLARAGLGFCFLTVTSPASWDLVFSLPTLRSQLSVFSFLLWG